MEAQKENKQTQTFANTEEKTNKTTGELTGESPLNSNNPPKFIINVAEIVKMRQTVCSSY